MSRMASNKEPANLEIPCSYCHQADNKVVTVTFPLAVPGDSWYGDVSHLHEDSSDCVVALLKRVAELEELLTSMGFSTKLEGT